MFSYGNLLSVAAGLMIFVTISAVLAGGGVASALFWGVPTVIILLIAIVPRIRASRRFKACSCPGYWYRRDCKHHRAYCAAVSLVEAQNAVNLAWDARRGGNVAVRASQKGN